MNLSETSPSSSPGEGREGLAALLARMQRLEALIAANTAQLEPLVPYLDQRLMELAVSVLEGQQQATDPLLAKLEEIASAIASGRPSESAGSSQTSTGLEERPQRHQPSRPTETPCAPVSNRPSESEAWSETLTELQELSRLLRTSALGSTRPSEIEDSNRLQALGELSKLGASLSRLDLALATTRTELLSALEGQTGPPAPAAPSTNEELLEELRTLWRKQEVYVLGLRAGLKADLEQMHLELRSQICADAKSEQEATRTALGAAVRQALSGRSQLPLLPEPEEPRRTPIGGIVILSSITSVLVTLGVLWLFR
jgi:hypothetical protein